jgi:hypothetical protein
VCCSSCDVMCERPCRRWMTSCMSPLRALKMCDILRRFMFADRMSSSTAGADAWLGARWNENMAGSATPQSRLQAPARMQPLAPLAASMHQSVYSQGAAQRGSPVSGGGRGDAASVKKDWGATIGGAAAVGGCNSCDYRHISQHLPCVRRCWGLGLSSTRAAARGLRTRRT